MKYLLIPFLTVLTTYCYAQKPPIGYSTIADWESLGTYVISNDGKYVSFEQQTRSSALADSLILITAEGYGRVVFGNAR